MKANPGKCHVILNSNTPRVILSEKLLEITLDSEPTFEKHINKICNIVNKKLNTIHLISSYMSLGK